MIRAAIIASLAGVAPAQPLEPHLGAASPIVPRAVADAPGQPTIAPAGPVVASLTYDGTSQRGFVGQDFESVFDAYDIWVVEVIVLEQDSVLTQFRSAAFATGNPFGATDFQVDVWPTSALSCPDLIELPTPLMSSIPGAGYFDGTLAITDFGNSCLPAGEFYVGWRIVMDFTCCGQMFFFAQAGAHDAGAGSPNDGVHLNPNNSFHFPDCFQAIDCDTGERTGINFILSGDPAGCEACGDPFSCGDWDRDADADSDDFFAFLESLAALEPCADLNNDASIDADDFFLFLDRFVNPC